MSLILLAIAAQLLCGSAAFLIRRNERLSSGIGAAGPVVGLFLGLAPVLRAVSGAPIQSMHAAWNMPLGIISLGLDGLSAFFLIPIFGLGALAAIYGLGYLRPYRESRSLGASWFFYNALISSMVMLVLARSVLLFLLAWEVMSLSSFFLVAFESEKSQVRQASWTYLVATHLGTAFLLAMFLLLGANSGTLDFAQLGGLTPRMAGLCFVLAVIGFGTKAGILPFHVWLPEAHPAAPSHVSALMSGVMIKTGIYGILRILTILGPPPTWWGFLLIALGLISGVGGVLFAMAQHDLKRLLAYHSVENIGIIIIGMGAGLLGISIGSPVLSVLGFAGCLLHVLNHAMFKGLLFMGAGSVVHRTHTLEIDHLGGLIKKMPWTAATFIVGAVAISGLPPLNGFVSEFLIYVGAFKGAISQKSGSTVALLSIIAGLSLIGGLATACFTKAFGIVFLGEPRSEHTAHAVESEKSLLIPMVVLSAGCIVVGLTGFRIVRALPFVLEGIVPFGTAEINAHLSLASGSLASFTAGGLALLALIALIVLVRRYLLSGSTVRRAGVWDCGYIKPTARMQYTASSFAQPIIDLFNVFQHGRKRFKAPRGYFPAAASFETETLDTSRENVYRPIFKGVEGMLATMKVMQHGRIQLYVLYIVLTLAVLLFWKLR
jgi:formate hydrogenlyase subunit 3/multisubunit Na+/H+ antiporter MnhD subunit